MSLNESSLENKFNNASASQASIQTLSFYCLHYKAYHKKIAQIWFKCLQKAKVSHRLTLIYLVNDIVQNAKRKGFQSFIDDFKPILKGSIPFLKDDKIKKPVERVFSIWQDRGVYDGTFIAGLKNSLNSNSRTRPPSAEQHSASAPVEPPKKKVNDDLIQCINRITSLELEFEKTRTYDDIVQQIAQETFSFDENDEKSVEDLRNYINYLKREIDERAKLAKLLEDSMSDQKKMLKQSEEQLDNYHARLKSIKKLRSELL